MVSYYATTQSPIHTIYDRKNNVVVPIHKTITKHAVSVSDSDDEIQQQPLAQRGKTKYECLKLVELRKLCKERD